MQQPLKHFKLSEFDSPDAVGSGSGYRTKAHNAKVGGVDDSSHCGGWAADIAATSGTIKFQIVNALLKAGFTRVGIANSFIHVDCDPTKPAQVIWTY